jgi:transposase InsO family protein
MQHLLAANGYHASIGRIHRLMQGLGLQARRGRTRRHRQRTGPSPALTAHITNHCQDESGQQDFTSRTPGVKIVGDITQVPTSDGPRYLAMGLDLATRRVIGWKTASVQDTALTTMVLTQARAQGLLDAEAIFHSDRGPQYTSHPFQDHCDALTVTQSMGRTGICYDNAAAESFFASLKADLRSELPVPASAAEIDAWVAGWIDDWYNPCRPHTANGGQPPLIAWDHARRENAALTDP